MTEAQMQALIARETSVAEGIRSDMARLEKIAQVRIAKNTEENKKYFDGIKAKKEAEKAKVAATHAAYAARPKRRRTKTQRYQ